MFGRKRAKENTQNLVWVYKKAEFVCALAKKKLRSRGLNPMLYCCYYIFNERRGKMENKWRTENYAINANLERERRHLTERVFVFTFVDSLLVAVLFLSDGLRFQQDFQTRFSVIIFIFQM